MWFLLYGLYGIRYLSPYVDIAYRCIVYLSEDARMAIQKKK
jgi:hypothetical protein